jgi:hypothetical protein
VGAARQELRHSDTLRFLLDPSAAHGFGAAFLGEFLKRALADQGLERFGPVEVELVRVDGPAESIEVQPVATEPS